MGCVSSKTKVNPVGSPKAKAAASPASTPKVKKAWGASKATPRKGTVDASATDACSEGSGSPQAKAAKTQQVVENGQATPVRLVKEADVANQEVTPSTVRESPASLFIKRSSQGSLKTDALLSAGSRDSGICLTAGENEAESANVITENSSPERQELAKAPNGSAPDLTVQGMCLQPPIRLSNTAKLGATTSRRPSGSGLPPLAQPPKKQQQQQLTLPNAICDDVKNLNITERPSSRGGMAFDINFDETSAPKRMPKGLQRRKKTSNLTKEELQAKLDAAERRRKTQEEERQEKIRAQLEHDHQVMNALEAFQKAQVAKTESQLNKKMTTNEENRENHFRELRNRLKEKNDKMMAAMESKKVKPLRPPLAAEEQSN